MYSENCNESDFTRRGEQGKENGDPCQEKKHQSNRTSCREKVS